MEKNADVEEIFESNKIFERDRQERSYTVKRIEVSISELHPHPLVTEYKQVVCIPEIKPLSHCDFSKFDVDELANISIISPIFVIEDKGKYLRIIGEETYNILKINGIDKCEIQVIKCSDESRLRTMIILDQHFSWLMKGSSEGRKKYFIKTTIELLKNTSWNVQLNNIIPGLRTKQAIAKFLDVSRSYVSRVLRD